MRADSRTNEELLDAARKASDKARMMRAGSQPDNVWDWAEMELLAAELDAAVSLPKL